MFRIQLFVVVLILLPLVLHANLEVGLLTNESTPDKTRVVLQARNAFDQEVTGARVMVLLVDAEGKVVGQQTQWLIGGTPEAQGSPPRQPLAPAELKEYHLVVPHVASIPGQPVLQPKLTFTRLIVGGEIVPNAQGSVVPLRKED